jgi:hypothetical protein
MDFRISDEQRMLDDSAAKFLAGQFTFDTLPQAARRRHRLRRKTLGRPSPNSAGWRCRSRKAVGGFGGTLVDIQLIARRLGERLCTDPVAGLRRIAGQGAGVCRHSPAANARCWTALVAGETRAALAAYEAASHYEPCRRIATTCRCGSRRRRDAFTRQQSPWCSAPSTRRCCW